MGTDSQVLPALLLRCLIVAVPQCGKRVQRSIARDECFLCGLHVSATLRRGNMHQPFNDVGEQLNSLTGNVMKAACTVAAQCFCFFFFLRGEEGGVGETWSRLQLVHAC